jgi:hypothetical protein
MKKNHEMPAQVRRVEEQFRGWRDGKDERERIPNRLWQAAVGLCEQHSVHKVSRWLHLNHTALQKKAVRQRRSIRRAPRFVEWRLPAGLAAGSATAAEYVVELGRDGTRRISVRGTGASEVAALVSALGGPASET